MANFGDTQANDIPVDIQAQPGVQNNAAAIGIQGSANAINTLAQGISNFGNFVSGQRKAAAAAASQGVVAQYALDLTNIANAQAQAGGYSKAEAQTRARALFTQAVASNPSLLSELSSAHASVVNTAGIGNIISKGTDQQKRATDLVDAATSEGFIPWNATQEQQLEGASLYQERERIKAEMSFQNSQLQNQKALNEFDKEANKINSQRSLASLSANENARSRIVLDSLSSEVKSGNITPEEAILAAKNQLSIIDQTASQLGGPAGGTYIDDMMKPTRDLYKTFEDNISGKLSEGVYKTQVENIINRQKLNTLGDPEIANIVATLDLLGPTATGALAQNAAVVRALGSLVNKDVSKSNLPNLSNPAQEKDTKSTLNTIKNNMDNKGEGVQEEVGTAVTNVLKGVDVYQQAVEDPTAYKNTVDFLADPKVGKWLSQNAVDPEVAQKAKDVFQREYNDVVVPLIEKELIDAQVSVGISGPTSSSSAATPASNFEPANKHITMKFVGDGVSFTVNPDAPTGTSGFDAKAKADLLNKTIAPHINRLTRLGAHLDGNQDYKRTFEENILPNILPQEATQAGETPQATSVPEPAQEASQDPSEEVTEGTEALSMAPIKSKAANNDALRAINENVVEENDRLDLKDFNALGYVQEGEEIDVVAFPAPPPETPRSRTKQVGKGNTIGNYIVFKEGVDQRVKKEVQDKWVQVQEKFGQTLQIESGFRDPSRNKKAGGAKKSQHMHGNAIDIDTGHLSNSEKIELIKVASEMGFTGVGVYNNNLHFDIAGRRAWGPTFKSASVPSWASKTIKEHMSR